MNVDVVIPTFNRFWAIQKVVPSYLAFPEVHKVIVVDDGGSDGTYEWLKTISIEEARLMVLRHEERRGACAARNTGAAKAEAPYVFFADDDMLLAPVNAFRILIDDLIVAGAEIIAPILEFQEGAELNISLIKGKEPADLFYLYNKMTLERKSMKTLLGCMPHVSFESGLLSGIMLMCRSVLDNVRYDEQLGDNSYRDETDFQLKAIGKGYRLLACPKVYLIDLFRLNDKGGCHTTNLVKYEFLCCRNNWRILKKHRKVLEKIQITVPIQMMQLLFMAEHLLSRLPRGIFFQFRQKLGLIRQL
jgi:glycosyltransferase involved in cell wall biosynthesis